MNWSRIPSLAALRAFEATARGQSFSKAARALNVTHAAIAQHVRSLEAEFGEALVVRQGRGLALSPAGQQLAEALSAGFETIAEGVEDLRRQSEDRPLNVSVTPSFASHWLMPQIGEFWASHPEVTLNINPSTDLVDMRRDGYDLAIRYGDGNWPGLEVELLTDGDFWVVAHPDLLEGRTTSCLSDVQDLPWFMESFMLERSALIAQEGVSMDTLNLTLLNTGDLVMSATLAGLGVTVQPRSLVEREIETGSLVRICALKQETLGYYIVTVPGRSPRGTGVFAKWLRSKASS